VNIYEFLPIRLLVEAAYTVVTGISDILEPLAGGFSAALAVIVLTVLVRAVLIPVGVSQVRAGITRKRLAPKISELQTKHKRASPSSCSRSSWSCTRRRTPPPSPGACRCWRRRPVLMAVYGLFINATIGGHANELLGHTLFGLPLNTSFVKLLGAGDLTGTAITVYLVLVVLIAVVAGFSRHLLTPATPEAPTAPPAKNGADAPAMPDLSGVMKTLSFMPFLTAIFALFVPLAAALYLATTTTWTLGERLVLNRLLGANEPQSEATTAVSG
jgi:YidC/Oxa1 family membrane protein insertase